MFYNYSNILRFDRLIGRVDDPGNEESVMQNARPAVMLSDNIYKR
jgi:hypothetical protein